MNVMYKVIAALANVPVQINARKYLPTDLPAHIHSLCQCQTLAVGA